MIRIEKLGVRVVVVVVKVLELEVGITVIERNGLIVVLEKAEYLLLRGNRKILNFVLDLFLDELA